MVINYIAVRINRIDTGQGRASSAAKGAVMVKVLPIKLQIPIEVTLL